MWSTWQQITTCAGPDGYRSNKTTWNGITSGDDNQANGKGGRSSPSRLGRRGDVVRIAITVEAFEAIARTLPLYENATNERGERLIWLDRAAVDRLRSLRCPGESFSDVIPRIAGR